MLSLRVPTFLFAAGVVSSPSGRHSRLSVAGAEIDHNVARLYLRNVEHPLEDRLRRRHIRRVELLVLGLRDRGAGTEKQPREQRRSEGPLQVHFDSRRRRHFQITAFLRNAAISASRNPASRRTSSVCSPDPGAGRTIANSNSLNLTGSPSCVSP